MRNPSIWLKDYLKTNHWIVVCFDVFRVLAVVVVTVKASDWVDAAAQAWMAPLHRKILRTAEFPTQHSIYPWIITVAGFANALWMSTALRNLARITILRTKKVKKDIVEAAAEKKSLPAWPYTREGFGVVLGELQDRDGNRVPNEAHPDWDPRWLFSSEKALYTGFIVIGAPGSGKTTAIAEPAMDQMVGFQRPIEVKGKDGRTRTDYMRWSGAVMDEKGDFCSKGEELMTKWGRSHQFIRLTPGGKWLWNPIYNPIVPPWAMGYQMAKVLKRFVGDKSASDPYWEIGPRELTLESLSLLADARDYYTIPEYMRAIMEDSYQDALFEDARARCAGDRQRMKYLEERMRRIKTRRAECPPDLLGSLKAVARAGLELFDYPEIRRTFAPSMDEYFTGPCCPWPKRVPRNEEEAGRFDEEHKNGVRVPQSNIFTGFDSILDYGMVVGLAMPKTIWYDSAAYMQVTLKSAWQEAVLRREATDETGRLLIPPRFGAEGYCPTFLMSDECQDSIVPSDDEFSAKCRSKRASCWYLSQSYSQIQKAFGQGNEAALASFIATNMTHIYMRQNDSKTIEWIHKEIGKRDVVKTSLGIAESGAQSEMSYVRGEVVSEGMNVTTSKNVTTEEKPFFEEDVLRQLPDFVAAVCASTGDRTLPVTMTFLRPSFLFRKHPEMKLEASWHDWPESMRKQTTLQNIPQGADYKASNHVVEEADLSHLVPRILVKSNGFTEADEEEGSRGTGGKGEDMAPVYAMAEEIREEEQIREEKKVVPSFLNAGPFETKTTQTRRRGPRG